MTLEGYIIAFSFVAYIAMVLLGILLLVICISVTALKGRSK